MKTYLEVFGKLNRSAVIPFFVIGDPDFETSLAIVKAAIDAGADILELGIPFSDPIADGPTIQKADIRAAKAGMDVKKALEFIRQIRQDSDVPIGLLMYYNLLYQYGVQKFFEDFHRAGVNSVLAADVSIDDSDEICRFAGPAGLDTVFMITPNTPVEKMRLIASKTTGFIYAVSLLGVTGARDNLSIEVSGLVRSIKQLTRVPVCVGFGISSPQHAAAVASAGADGVIIGSRVVKFIEDNLGDKKKMLSEIAKFIREVKAAVDS